MEKRNAIFFFLPPDVRIRYGQKVNDMVPIPHTLSCGQMPNARFFDALVPRSLTQTPDKFDESELSIHCSDISVCGSRRSPCLKERKFSGKEGKIIIIIIKKKRIPSKPQHLWPVVSFRSFVPFQPPYPPLHPPPYTSPSLLAVGTWSFCTIKVFLIFLLLSCAMMAAQWTASFLREKKWIPDKNIDALFLFLCALFLNRYTISPFWINPRSAHVQGRPTSAYDEFISALCLCVGTKSGTCRWRTKGADVTLSFKRFQTSFYAIIKIRRKSK